jgi:hypothetical protein
MKNAVTVLQATGCDRKFKDGSLPQIPARVTILDEKLATKKQESG